MYILYNSVIYIKQALVWVQKPDCYTVSRLALKAVTQLGLMLSVFSQIAVDHGFGGACSQQKAEWMVDALQQYFTENGQSRWIIH